MAGGTDVRQLALEYEGELEFIFVVESVEDAAYSVLTQLNTECQVSKEPCGPLRSRLPFAPSHGSRGRVQDVRMRVILAGLSRRCSQKIHNQMAGPPPSSHHTIPAATWHCTLMPAILKLPPAIWHNSDHFPPTSPPVRPSHSLRAAGRCGIHG